MSRSDLPALRLFEGHTLHRRYTPFKHGFRYGLGMIDLDIDRMDEVAGLNPFFRVDQAGLFSFRSADHGARQPGRLRAWAERQFAQANIDLQGGSIRLLTFPRHFGYKFSPLSLWLGFGQDHQLKGLLYEVNNTFSETHTYIARTPEPDRHQHYARKVFHVSPFFDVSGTYRFTLRVSSDKLSLMIATFEGETETHLATLQGRFREASKYRFLRLALIRPFSTFGVSLAIHWQAFKLWLKGAVYHPKPKQGEPRMSIARQKN